MPPLPLIIDCDPGVDDAIALLLTLAAPELDLLGITAVAGNVPLVLTEKNARKICQLAGRTEIGVYAGCPRPMMRTLVTAEHVHGSTGLEGAELPEPTMPLRSQHAVSFLIEQLIQAQQPITIAALGPLTNIAIALIQQSAIVQNIEEIVIMGGAIARGNVTPSAEFNFYVDPHAAKVVFESGAKLTLLSLDVTHQVLTTPERLGKMRGDWFSCESGRCRSAGLLWCSRCGETWSAGGTATRSLCHRLFTKARSVCGAGGESGD